MSNVTLTYYGHATFALSNGDVTLVCDPFFTGNTWDVAKAEDSVNIFLYPTVMMIIMVIPI